jgi:hypothetical protein
MIEFFLLMFLVYIWLYGDLLYYITHIDSYGSIVNNSQMMEMINMNDVSFVDIAWLDEIKGIEFTEHIYDYPIYWTLVRIWLFLSYPLFLYLVFTSTTDQMFEAEKFILLCRYIYMLIQWVLLIIIMYCWITYIVIGNIGQHYNVEYGFNIVAIDGSIDSVSNLNQSINMILSICILYIYLLHYAIYAYLIISISMEIIIMYAVLTCVYVNPIIVALLIMLWLMGYFSTVYVYYLRMYIAIHYSPFKQKMNLRITA